MYFYSIITYSYYYILLLHTLRPSLCRFRSPCNDPSCFHPYSSRKVGSTIPSIKGLEIYSLDSPFATRDPLILPAFFLSRFTGNSLESRFPYPGRCSSRCEQVANNPRLSQVDSGQRGCATPSTLVAATPVQPPRRNESEWPDWFPRGQSKHVAFDKANYYQLLETMESNFS